MDAGTWLLSVYGKHQVDAVKEDILFKLMIILFVNTLLFYSYTSPEFKSLVITLLKVLFLV